jgi:hypothetical protein
MPVPSVTVQANSTAEATDDTLDPPCPCCGGRMRIIEVFKRGQTPSRRSHARTQDDDVLNNFEPELLSAVKQLAHSNDSVPWGAPLREVKERDASGREALKFVGERSFVHDFKAPVRRVLSFATSNGRWDAVKARWF